MVPGFHRAGACGDDYVVAAYGYTSAQVDDRTFGSELAAGEFEGLRDAHHFADAVEEFEVAVIEIAMDANGTQNGVGFAGGTVDVEAAGDQAIDDVLDLGV